MYLMPPPAEGEEGAAEAETKKKPKKAKKSEGMVLPAVGY